MTKYIIQSDKKLTTESLEYLDKMIYEFLHGDKKFLVLDEFKIYSIDTDNELSVVEN